MGIPMGKNQKMSASAMQARLNQNIRVSSQKERMLRKLEQRRAQKVMEQMQQQSQEPQNFKQMKFKADGGEVEKSLRTNLKKKKKKKKKKKNKK